MFPVKDFMTKNPITVEEHTSIYDAIELLATYKISGLPVVDKENRLVGVISEWDVLHLLTDAEVNKNATVGDYMTRDVISFKEDDSAIDVCDFFKNSNKRRVPIVNDGKLVGIVSRHDIIKLILSMRKNVSEARDSKES